MITGPRRSRIGPKLTEIRASKVERARGVAEEEHDARPVLRVGVEGRVRLRGLRALERRRGRDERGAALGERREAPGDRRERRPRVEGDAPEGLAPGVPGGRPAVLDERADARRLVEARLDRPADLCPGKPFNFAST